MRLSTIARADLSKKAVLEEVGDFLNISY